MEETLRSLISAGSYSQLVCWNISRSNYGASSARAFRHLHVLVPAATSVGKQVKLSQRAFDSMYTQP